MASTALPKWNGGGASAGSRRLARDAHSAEPGRRAGLTVRESIIHMAASATALLDRPSHDAGGEDFASLLNETLGRDTGFEGSVVTGRVGSGRP